jgi:hypothetical protein
MSAWVDVVDHSPTTKASSSLTNSMHWIHDPEVPVTVSISIIAMLISTLAISILEYSCHFPAGSVGNRGVAKVCWAIVGSGLAVSGAAVVSMWPPKLSKLDR